VGAPWRTAGLLGGFRLVSREGWSGSGFWGRCHVFSFDGDYRHDIDHSSRPVKQGISSPNGHGDEQAMALKSGQMSADVLR
jgi:hypothetical protein